MNHVLYAVACAAPPTQHITGLITTAQQHGWDVCLITTPTAATSGSFDGPRLSVIGAIMGV